MATNNEIDTKSNTNAEQKLNINNADDRSKLKQKLFEELYEKAKTRDDSKSPAFYRLLIQLIDLVETPKKKGVDDCEGIQKLLKEVRQAHNKEANNSE